MLIYFSAALAKLRPDWLSGETAAGLVEHGLIGGWATSVAPVVLAWSALVAELGIPLLLMSRRTRTVGVVAAFAFHLSIEPAMMVSTFGAQMLLLVMLFLPWQEPPVAGAPNL